MKVSSPLKESICEVSFGYNSRREGYMSFKINNSQEKEK